MSKVCPICKKDLEICMFNKKLNGNCNKICRECILHKNTYKRVYECIHGKNKYICKLCNGSSLCMHNNQKHQCKICNNKDICPHGMMVKNCNICSMNEAT